MKISKKSARFLLDLARRSIEYFLETKNFLAYEKLKIPEKITEEVNQLSGAFIVLEMTKNEYRKAYVRGENGVFEKIEALGKLITQISVNAAFFDPATPRLKAYELNELIVHLYIPSERKKLHGEYASILAQLDGVSGGIIVESRGRLACSLPALVGEEEEVEHRVRTLRLKLGIKKKAAESAEYYSFSGQHFKEVIA
ncbi:AMMECR1 domain-containing protein [bacterium]|nr:AMMECR1 domain-containing protein [bacterium]